LGLIDIHSGGVQGFSGTEKFRMKTILITIAAATLMAGNLTAGPDVIIRERAKELRDQNNVRQGVPPPTQPTQPPSLPNAPAAPTLSPSLTRFQTELASIKAETPVTPEQKQKLAQDLILAAQGTKPSLAAANKLADDLSAAFVEKPLSATSRARLTQELDAVLNPAKYPQAKMDGIFTDIQAIFQENGLARAKAAAIADDVKKLAKEVQGSGAT
jgi:hypothetical protein